MDDNDFNAWVKALDQAFEKDDNGYHGAIPKVIFCRGANWGRERFKSEIAELKMEVKGYHNAYMRMFDDRLELRQNLGDMTELAQKYKKENDELKAKVKQLEADRADLMGEH